MPEMNARPLWLVDDEDGPNDKPLFCLLAETPEPHACEGCGADVTESVEVNADHEEMNFLFCLACIPSYGTLLDSPNGNVVHLTPSK